MRVLVIEDDPEVAEIVTLCFEMRWPDIKILRAELGQDGIYIARSETPDLILLDLGLPDMDGFDVCSQIRSSSDVPIVMLTARNSADHRTKGLEVGADEYISKPFRPVELLTAANNVLRSRMTPHLRAISMAIHRNEVSLDFVGGRLYANHEPVALESTAYRIFHYLVRNEGKVVSTQALMEHIWGHENQDRQESLVTSFADLRGSLHSYPGLGKLLEEVPLEGYSFARDMT